MEFLKSRYLSKEALENLKYYKYGAIDLSPLSRFILQPYWTWSLQWFPLWMAPNLITLVGLGFVAINVVFATIFIPDLVGPSEPWIYFSFAAGIWLYSTFDNVDGKQARRTGTSSPLGELFDHGCDSLNCSFGAVIQAAAIGLGHSWEAVYIGFLAICAFYFSTWEEYYTGVMYLGFVNGPTEGLFLSCATMIISGIYGPQIWSLPLHSFLPAGFFPGLTISLFKIMAIGMSLLLFFFHIPVCLYNVYTVCKKKNISFLSALFGTWQIIVYFGSCYFWLNATGSIILTNNCILFILTAGIVFGRIATKIILAYVTKMPFPNGTNFLWPLVIGAFLSNSNLLFQRKIFTPESENLFLWASFIILTLSYVNSSLVIIEKFCAHLNIKCLSIPYPPKKTTKTG